MKLRLAFLTMLFAAPAAAASVLAVDLDGIIHPITTEIVRSAIDQAQREHAELLLIRIDTPGGLMNAMRESISAMVAAPVPVAVFVSPSGGRAASAGFFLLMSADIAAMAPGTNTGAAHPVLLGGQMDAVMKQKAENDAAAYLRSLAGKRGRNAELAEKAVLESRSFTEREALDQHLIDRVAKDDRDLLSQLDGREIVRFDGRRQTLHTAGAAVVTYERTLRQRIVAAIADPNIALVLVVLGALCIYLEFTSPGLIAPGAAGAILVLLGLSALSVLPLSWLGASLVLLAFTLFVLEAKIASHGILGAGGAIALTLGAMLLVDSPVPELRIRWTTAAGLALPFSAITVWLLALAVRARRNKVETGAEGMVGSVGTVLTAIEPKGKILVHGEYWDALAAGPLAPGTPVRVIAIDGLTLTVEAASKGASK